MIVQLKKHVKDVLMQLLIAHNACQHQNVLYVLKIYI